MLHGTNSKISDVSPCTDLTDFDIFHVASIVINCYLYLQNDLSSFFLIVVTNTCEQTAKGTSGYYKVVFIALTTIITKFSLNP